MEKRKKGDKLPQKIRDGFIAQVYEMLLVGCYRRDIIQFADKNQWGISVSTLDDYIVRVKKELAADIKKQELDTLHKFVKSAWHLYSRSYSKGDYALCNSIRQDMQKLQDRYPIEKKQIDVDMTTKDDDAQIAKIVNSRLKELNAKSK